MTWSRARNVAVVVSAAALIAMVVTVQFWSLLPARKALATTPTPTNTFTPLPPDTHKVGGTVCDAFPPGCLGLHGVTVRLDPGNRMATTNQNGDFSFPGTADGSYTITVEYNTTSATYLPVSIDVHGASVRVTISPIPPTPIRACGDANGDGVVNAIDALLTLQYVVRLVDVLPRPDIADADGDGRISSLDALLMLQMSAGSIHLGTPPCRGAVSGSVR